MRDVVVHPKISRLKRHVASTVPIGNVHIMLFQHPLHRRSEKSGKVAGQGSHDQHLRIVSLHLPLEVKQIAKR